jgi:phage head maturation protease
MSKPRKNELQHRFAAGEALSAGAPISYDADTHTVEAVISKGSPVARPYGIEVLRISPQAIDLSRLRDGGVPLLDHHRQDGINSILGKVTDAWIEGGALVGRIKFNATPEGQKAEGMVARGEVAGISAGYRVDSWLITDADGGAVDERNIRWDDDLTFTATRWALYECSVVGVPADGAAMVRSLGGHNRAIADIRARMQARHRMVMRTVRNV